MAQSIRDDAEAGKHDQARDMAESALRAESRGEHALADRLLDQADNTDPEAVESVLRDSLNDPTRLHHRYAKHGGRAASFGDDESVAAITHTIRARSDASARTGMTQNGSGADNERR